MVGRVVHFEIHAGDTARAAKFYQDVFGWKVTKWDGPMEYWLVATGEGPGIDGGILPRIKDPGHDQAPKGYVCTISCEDLEQSLAAIEKAGGSVVIAKDEIPGIGWLAYAHDTEGNVFGILQPT